SENPDLPDVPRLHTATVTYPCNRSQPWLDTDQGISAPYYGPSGSVSLPVLPATLRLETLRDSGQPEVEQDNQSSIQNATGPVSKDTSGSTADHHGCAVDGRTTIDATLLLVACGAFLMTRARRRYRA